MAKTNKKTQKIVKKELKKMPSSLKIVAALVFIFASVGAFLTSYMMQKNDCFELIGDQVVTMYIGGSYQEPEVKEAIKCISFGMDATSSVYINEEETTYDPNTSVNNEGTYYIVYQTTNFKYSSITRIRTIIVNVVDENEDGIGED